MKDKIIERVKKILAIANDNTGASAAERETAMKMAHTYLIKHNLSMSEVSSKSKDAIDEDRGNVVMSGQRTHWERSIINSIASLFFCKYFHIKGKKHFFIGRKDNIITAIEIVKFVLKSVDKEADKLGAGRHDFSVFKRGFCVGASNAIYHRTVIMKDEAEQENKPAEQGATGTALTVTGVYDSEDSANKNYISTVLNIKLKATKERKLDTTLEGMIRGLEYGDKIHLGKQIQ